MRAGSKARSERPTSDRGPYDTAEKDITTSPQRSAATAAQRATAAAARPSASDVLTLQRTVGNREVGRLLAGSSRAGEPLPEALRAKMESAYEADFSDVRVHRDGEAERLHARAFARGADLHFAQGQYDPVSGGGQELIGHELWHVVQQRQGRVRADPALGDGINADPGLESEADAQGRRAAHGQAAGAPRGAGASPATTPAAGPVQRMPSDDESENDEGRGKDASEEEEDEFDLLLEMSPGERRRVLRKDGSKAAWFYREAMRWSADPKERATWWDELQSLQESDDDSDVERRDDDENNNNRVVRSDDERRDDRRVGEQVSDNNNDPEGKVRGRLDDLDELAQDWKLIIAVQFDEDEKGKVKGLSGCIKDAKFMDAFERKQRVDGTDWYLWQVSYRGPDPIRDLIDKVGYFRIRQPGDTADRFRFLLEHEDEGRVLHEESGVAVRAGAALRERGTKDPFIRDGFTVAYSDSDPEKVARSHVLQFVWREAYALYGSEPKYMSGNSQPLGGMGAPYPWAVGGKPAPENINVDGGGFVDVPWALAGTRAPNSIRVHDEPTSGYPGLVQRAFHEHPDADQFVSAAHFDIFLITEGKPSYRIKLDVTWRFTPPKEGRVKDSPAEYTLAGAGPVSTIERPFSDRLTKHDASSKEPLVAAEHLGPSNENG